MKKLSLLLFLCGIGMSALFAQTITITGTVTSSVENESAVPGASVQLKGAGTGTITDVDGAFSINVPQDAATLVFSCVGMKKQEVDIEGRTVINVVMEPEIISLEEATITTAYEIKRAPRSTSALIQVVSGDKLNEVRQTNFNSALVGKVSGIQFRGQSAMALDRTGSINLRGDGGFSTGNSVLYVVDGTIITNSDDLNLDDIEDISVLSGPGASALLGSQGANGAIIITTKKAKFSGENNIEIEINSGIMTSSVYILPDYQNDYAGGSLDSMIQYSWKPGDPVEWQSLDGKFYPDYADDRNWGPKMEGQEYIPWYSWYPGTKYTGTTATLIPQPDNVRDFYDRGWTYNNNIAFSRTGENFRIRTVLGNVAVKGNIPGSSLNKTNFAIKTSYDPTRNLSLGANINFFTTMTNGEFDDGWTNHTTGSFNEFFHRDLDMEILRELKGLKTPEGIYASWNHKAPTVYDPENPKEFYAATYWYNFYTYYDLIKLPSRTDRFFGDISLNYKIFNGLSAKITYRRQQVNGWREKQYSSDLYFSQLYSTYFHPEYKGYYYTGNQYSNRDNFESLFTYTKRIDDFAINANAGSDFFSTISKSTSANTNNGLNIPNLFTIENSIDQPDIRNSRVNEKYRALFLRGDIGYKNYLFGEFSLRNDWYSTLPPSDNSIFSKSFGVSFVFSDLLHFSFLNHGKVRASWGEIPTAIGPYIYPGGQYNVELYRRYGNIMMSTPDQLVDEDIHGAVKTQKELGLDLLFLSNRIGFNATWWDGTEKDIPYEVPVAGYSGFNSRYMNTGKIIKQGLDFTLHLEPVIRTNLDYELNAAFSYLIRDEVVSIGEGIESFYVTNYFFPEAWPQMVHAEGRPWGELHGWGMKMLEGKPVLNDDGSYVIEENKNFGSVLPKVTGGVQNSIRILKNFTVIANIDFQIGGRYASVSENTGDWAGLSARTGGLNDKGNPIRDPVAEGGGIHVTGVLEDSTAYNNYIDTHDYFDNLYVFDSYVHKLTYVKLRELSIGYRIPVEHIRELSNTIKAINISFFCINPWLIYSESKDFDPSEISWVYGEVAQYPATRSFGLNLKVNF